MRLGGPIFAKHHDPDSWVAAVAAKGYRAAYCPLDVGADDEQVAAYAAAAKAAGVVVAEVGAWSNPLSLDCAEARRAFDKCVACLDLAERIGARCCVNISGSRGRKWDGPHPTNLTRETFDRIVEVTRRVIDAVKPCRTFFTLETMPWMYPDSADSYADLLRAVDRAAFGVHFDPVNLVCSPRQAYETGDLIRDFTAKLGPHIRSCHAKDIVLADRLTVHMDETVPGRGSLCYLTYLQELARLDADVPLMLEHMADEQQYDEAADYIRAVGRQLALEL